MLLQILEDLFLVSAAVSSQQRCLKSHPCLVGSETHPLPLHFKNTSFLNWWGLPWSSDSCDDCYHILNIAVWCCQCFRCSICNGASTLCLFKKGFICWRRKLVICFQIFAHLSSYLKNLMERPEDSGRECSRLGLLWAPSLSFSL